MLKSKKESRLVGMNTITGITYLTDAFVGFDKLADNSIDALITDPPYFLDGMGDTWQDSMIQKKTTEKQIITSLRAGMKFDKQQGIQFQDFMNKVATQALSKIKPGGWIVSFSAPRLYHRLAVGIEDAGYEIRDMWEWLYTQNQMKAMGMLRQLEKDSSISEEDKKRLESELLQWKTPQVKSCFEPIVLAQKPREGTFYDNWKKYHIGLVNVKTGEIGTGSDMSTANVISTEHISKLLDQTFLVGKPTRKEKGETTHLSVKPLSLMEHLIKVLVPEGGTVLDPFNGSGTTGIAALNTRRNFIGYENNREYYEQSLRRNSDAFIGETLQEESNCYTVALTPSSDFALI